jgi:hypothetical protein
MGPRLAGGCVARIAGLVDGLGPKKPRLGTPSRALRTCIPFRGYMYGVFVRSMCLEEAYFDHMQIQL